ncbi:hypothetical protein KG091_04465 [Carnobacteriaceae bacterium zg-ZUI78]|nr:hypothetical protein [Carnobacteriaceae bacterium zg-ZUI78]
MNETTILQLVKMRLGISTKVRDAYLSHIIKGAIDFLEKTHGVFLDEDNMEHQMFVVDYVSYRYTNQDSPTFPRHLQWRLHNLIVSSKRSDALDVE